MRRMECWVFECGGIRFGIGRREEDEVWKFVPLPGRHVINNSLNDDGNTVTFDAVDDDDDNY